MDWAVFAIACWCALWLGLIISVLDLDASTSLERIGWWFYRRAMIRRLDHEEYLAFCAHLHGAPYQVWWEARERRRTGIEELRVRARTGRPVDCGCRADPCPVTGHPNPGGIVR